MSCDKTLVLLSIFSHSSIHLPFLPSSINGIWNFSLDKSLFLLSISLVRFIISISFFFQHINFIIARWWHTFDAFVHNTEILLDINQSNVARVTNRPNKNVQRSLPLFSRSYTVFVWKAAAEESDQLVYRSIPSNFETISLIRLISIALLWSHLRENNMSAKDLYRSCLKRIRSLLEREFFENNYYWVIFTIYRYRAHLWRLW